MKNFVYQNPTKLVFGKGQIAKLSELIPKEKKIMVTFGGGSVKKNGVYDQVKAALAGHQYVEFWGIEPNPSVETVREAVALGRKYGADFLLAVGGGSVLDGTKLIAAALGSREKIDPWSIVQKGFAPEAIPFASVMTLPATGSEMNGGAVISRKETNEKYAFGGNYPEFSILDPETTYSLPSTQIANGLSDVFVHVMEQYMTTPGQSRVMDRWAEGILLTLLDIAPKIKEDQKNYDVMADFMLSATLALNDMIQMGVTQDWATHMLGHELTALTGIAHGASLAIVYPAMLRVLKEQKHDKLLQYAERVFGITTGSEEERIDKAIEATEAYFKSLGLATRLSEAGIGEDVIAEVERRFTERGTKVGEERNVDGKMARKVLESCK